MASAWEQAGESARANQRMRQLQLSLAVGNEPARAAFRAARAPTRCCASQRPHSARLRRRARWIRVANTSRADRLVGGALQATSSAMRASHASAGRSRGASPRRALVRSATELDRQLNTGTGAIFITAGLPTWRRSARCASACRRREARELPRGDGRHRGRHAWRPLFRIVAEGQPVPVAAARGSAAVRCDNAAARDFRAAAQGASARVNPARTHRSFRQSPRRSRWTICARRWSQIEPRRFAGTDARAGRRPAARQRPSTRRRTRRVGIEPIMAAPKFPQPMYESLRDLSQDLLLPGLETVEPDSVLGLETNSRFVEAYMVGLNFEMGARAAVARLSDRSARHVLRPFWDSRASKAAAPDIDPIHGWGDRPLGDPQTRAGGRALRDADAQRAVASLSERGDLRGAGDRRTACASRPSIRRRRASGRFAARCSRT